MRVIALLLTALLVFPLTPAANAGGPVVSVTDDAFTPDIENLPRPGYAVPWHWAPGLAHAHNVRQDARLFRSGEPTSAATTFERAFSAGTFHYYCEVHGSPSGGMDGKVRVPVWILSTPDESVFSVIWATEGSRTGKAFDVKYRIDDGPWVAWRTDTLKDGARFGKNDKPVPVEAFHAYDIRARSQKRVDTPKKVSGWSPIGTYVFP